MGHRFEIYRDNAERFRFRFRAGNGQIMAASTDSYERAEECRTAIALIQSGHVSGDYYEDQAGEHRWRILNGDDILCVASEGYSTKRSAIESFESVTERAPEAPVTSLVDA